MMQTTPLLPQRYYLDNFQLLIDHALGWYTDILTQNEKEWICSFIRLPDEAKCLLVRLLARKGELFRSDKLSYQEIPDIKNAARILFDESFIDIDPDLELRELMEALLTKPEIIKLFPEADRQLKKPVLIDTIVMQPTNLPPKLPFEVYKLRNFHVIDLLTLLFFANTRQDLSQFVTNDLGIHKFEQYELSSELRFFKTRVEIDALLRISIVSEKYYALTDKDEQNISMLLQSLPATSGHRYVDRKRDKAINLLARELERLGLLEDALGYFKQSKTPPSRERQVRILEKMDRDTEAKCINDAILCKPIDNPEYEVAKKLQSRLMRKSGKKVPRIPKPDYTEKRIPLNLSVQRVEHAVMEHMQEQGWIVFYTENTLLNSLFGLAFWEIIFAPIEGAFINAYQHQPADLYHEDFVTKRSVLIKLRLAEISSGNFTSIRNNFESKQGITNPFVHWKSLTSELITLTLASFPPALLSQLMSTLLSDLRHYRSGMPDLIAFKNQTFRWIEVKGPGDKLHESQWRWIKVYNELSVPFEVFYVDNV